MGIPNRTTMGEAINIKEMHTQAVVGPTVRFGLYVTFCRDNV
jgi:hypothetical protein